MKLKCFFMSMFAIAALASCNNDDEIQGETLDGNDSSWIGVSVSLPASAFSRAADGDPNAEAVETAIKTISLYYKKTDGSVDAISTAFVPGDFTKSGAVYTASKAAEVPFAAGEKVDIYAAVNIPATNAFMPNWFNFKGTAGNPDVNYWTATSATLSDATDGFTMTGTAQATTYGKDVDALAATHAKISIERVVAKVLVTASDGGIDPTTNFEEKNPNGPSGKFQANTLKWVIGNDNRKLYLLSETNDKDPNWEKLAASVTDDELNKEYSNRAPSSYTMSVPKFADVTATGYKADGTANVQYCNENTNEIYQYGNTSFISIQTVFVPDNIVKSVTGTVAGKDLIMKAVANDLGAVDFYYNAKELKYFTADAYTAAIAAGVSANEFKGVYKNGECYYFVPIKNQTGEIGVLRNTYYTMRIKSLKAPGEPTPNSEDKDKEVEQNSWIAVDFEVAAWDSQSMGDLDLE